MFIQKPLSYKLAFFIRRIKLHPADHYAHERDVLADLEVSGVFRDEPGNSVGDPDGGSRPTRVPVELTVM